MLVCASGKVQTNGRITDKVLGISKKDALVYKRTVERLFFVPIYQNKRQIKFKINLRSQ